MTRVYAVLGFCYFFLLVLMGIYLADSNVTYLYIGVAPGLVVFVYATIAIIAEGVGTIREHILMFEED